MHLGAFHRRVEPVAVGHDRQHTQDIRQKRCGHHGAQPQPASQPPTLRAHHPHHQCHQDQQQVQARAIARPRDLKLPDQQGGSLIGGRHAQHLQRSRHDRLGKLREHIPGPRQLQQRRNDPEGQQEANGGMGFGTVRDAHFSFVYSTIRARKKRRCIGTSSFFRCLAFRLSPYGTVSA